MPAGLRSEKLITTIQSHLHDDSMCGGLYGFCFSVALKNTTEAQHPHMVVASVRSLLLKTNWKLDLG